MYMYVCSLLTQNKPTPTLPPYPTHSRTHARTHGARARAGSPCREHGRPCLCAHPTPSCALRAYDKHTTLPVRRSPSCAPGCTWQGGESLTDRTTFPGSGLAAAVVGVVGTCSVSWCAADSSPAPVIQCPGGQRGYPGCGGASFLAARAWRVPVSWQAAHAAALQTLPRRCCPAVSGSGVPAPFPRIQ